MKKMKKIVAIFVAMLMFGANVSHTEMMVHAEGVYPTVETELTREKFLKNVRDSLNNPSFEYFRNESNTSNLGYYNWCAAYVEYYLGVDVSGKENYNRDVDEIVKAYRAAGRFHEAKDGYLPTAGDLVVYDENGDPDDGYEHIGVVSGVNSATGEITTIEGNAYCWRPRKSGINDNSKLDFDCHEKYDIVFNGAEVSDFEAKIGPQGFELCGTDSEGRSLFKENKDACWDYFYDSNRKCHYPENRTVTEFMTKDVKTLFIAGYLTPNFKESVKKNDKESTVNKNTSVTTAVVNKDVIEKRTERITSSKIIVSSKNNYNRDKECKEFNLLPKKIILPNNDVLPIIDYNNDGCVNVADIVWAYRYIV